MSLEKQLLRALDNRKLPDARKIIAQMPPDSKTAAKGERPKQEAYQLLFIHAIFNGDLNTALEVAVFANVTVTEKNLRDCMRVARKNNDLKTILECRERLGGKLSIMIDLFPVLGILPDSVELSKDCPLLSLLINFCFPPSNGNGGLTLIDRRLAQICIDPSKGTNLERKLITLYDWQKML